MTRSPTVRAALAAALTLAPALGSAETNPAYSHEPSLPGGRADWMAGLPGTLRLADLTLPGSHDTMTGEYTGVLPGVQTQTVPLATQLEAGLRVVDIRCRHVNDAFEIHHGIVDLGMSFSQVLDTVTSFLARHPGETVLMSVQEEDSPAGDSRSFADTFDAYWRQPAYAPFFWQPRGGSPTLADTRGRIVVIQSFAAPRSYGLDPSGFDAQNQWDVPTIFALYDKWMAVKQQLARADASAAGSRPFFSNNLAGSTGVLPFFVASGKVTPGTGDPLLLTGLTTPAFGSWYPDFPRVGCFLGLCSIAYEGTNPLAWRYLTDPARAVRYAGIVYMDFPGQGLIDVLIGLNRRP